MERLPCCKYNAGAAEVLRQGSTYLEPPVTANVRPYLAEPGSVEPQGFAETGADAPSV